jgi:hypothetical protein
MILKIKITQDTSTSITSFNIYIKRVDGTLILIAENVPYNTLLNDGIFFNVTSDIQSIRIVGNGSVCENVREIEIPEHYIQNIEPTPQPICLLTYFVEVLSVDVTPTMWISTTPTNTPTPTVTPTVTPTPSNSQEVVVEPSLSSTPTNTPTPTVTPTPSVTEGLPPSETPTNTPTNTPTPSVTPSASLLPFDGSCHVVEAGVLDLADATGNTNTTYNNTIVLRYYNNNFDLVEEYIDESNSPRYVCIDRNRAINLIYYKNNDEMLITDSTLTDLNTICTDNNNCIPSPSTTPTNTPTPTPTNTPTPSITPTTSLLPFDGSCHVVVANSIDLGEATGNTGELSVYNDVLVLRYYNNSLELTEEYIDESNSPRYVCIDMATSRTIGGNNYTFTYYKDNIEAVVPNTNGSSVESLETSCSNNAECIPAPSPTPTNTPTPTPTPSTNPFISVTYSEGTDCDSPFITNGYIDTIGVTVFVTKLYNESYIEVSAGFYVINGTDIVETDSDGTIISVSFCE